MVQPLTGIVFDTRFYAISSRPTPVTPIYPNDTNTPTHNAHTRSLNLWHEPTALYNGKLKAESGKLTQRSESRECSHSLPRCKEERPL